MKNITPIAVAFACVSSLLTSVNACAGQDIERAIETLTSRDAHPKAGFASDDVQSLVQAIHEHWDSKRTEEWPAVLAILESVRLVGDLRGDQRGRVMEAVVERASKAELAELVQRAAERVAALDRPSRVPPERRAGEAMAYQVVANLARSDRWRELPDTPERLRLLEGTIAITYVVRLGGIPPNEPALELWLQTPMTAPAREQSAVSIVAQMRHTDLVPPEIANAISSETGRQHLRELLRAGQTYQTFHKGAAAALAEIGDQASLPILEALPPRIVAAAAREPEVFRRPDVFSAITWRFADRIRVQKTPQRILEYIATYPEADPADYLIKEWAVGRAVRMGIPREQIRGAVLSYLEAARAADRAAGRGATVCLICEAAARYDLISDDEYVERRVPRNPGPEW